jgi:hypothetical protein
LAFLFDVREITLTDVSDFKGDNGLSENLSGRTFGRVEEPDGLFIGVELVAFCDIAWDANRSASDLVSETIVLGKVTLTGQFVNEDGKILRSLLNLKLFKLTRGYPTRP